MTETRSTCPYCGVGCGVVIESTGAQITGVRGDPDHPANFGRLCSKGSTLHLTAAASVTRQNRLLTPMLRPARDQPAQAIAWERALAHATRRLADIAQAHGPDAIGIYVSGQLLTEDYYVFNKLAKGLLGTNNIDTNSRLCMSSAVAGYKATLGADAPPACYDDIALARTLFISGANPAWAHPILFRRIEDAKRANPALRLIVVDPRRTETAEMADLHLPLLPGSDVALCHGLLHLMLWEGLLDDAYIAAHTQGFAALKTRVREFTPRQTALLTGLTEDAIVQAARWFAGLDDGPAAPRTPTLSLYCQGLNQSAHGTANNAALINLHLACGQIGRSGAGPLSLTGQPNAMGGREVGGLANQLSAHRDLANPVHRAEVARLWGVADVPATPGKSALEMFEAAADGQIKALWIACTNPAQSLPDQATVRRALQRCAFVVLQEAFRGTATERYADLLLPASSWGEKHGTVTNSERRISRVRAAVPAPGEARDDWRIARDVARGLEQRLRPGLASLFPYESAEDVWLEHRESTRGRDLDISGLSYAVLDRHGPQQWPCPSAPAHDAAPGALACGQARLYTDGRFATADGRAQFFDTPFAPLAEPRDTRYPFSLGTGRLRDQWHGMSRTGALGRLFGHAPEPAIEMHARDAARLGLGAGDLVQVTSRRGSIVLPWQASDSLAPTQTFIAMHWGEEFVSGRSRSGEVLSGVNALTSPARCPISLQPELKHCAVKLVKAELPWRLLGLAWFDDEVVLDSRDALRRHLADFPFASCVPFGHQRSGLLFRAAAFEAPAGATLARIEDLLGLSATASGVLRYDDRKRGHRRSLRLVADKGGGEAGTRRIEALLLAGDSAAESWLKPLLQDQLPAQDHGRFLLAPGGNPPLTGAARGRQVCNCLDVREPTILDQLTRCQGTPEQRLAQLQQALACGTQCGSCLPELHRLVRQAQAPSADPAAVAA